MPIIAEERLFCKSVNQKLHFCHVFFMFSCMAERGGKQVRAGVIGWGCAGKISRGGRELPAWSE